MGGGGAGFPMFFRLSALPISDNTNNCDFSILTTLASPEAGVISKLNVGDDLLLRETDSSRVLQVTTLNGVVCGVLISRTRRIIACMAKGSTFSVKIVLINGAECQVLVQSANKE
jgi:hypothetical protein